MGDAALLVRPHPRVYSRPHQVTTRTRATVLRLMPLTVTMTMTTAAVAAVVVAAAVALRLLPLVHIGIREVAQRRALGLRRKPS
jgi:hypothetical protein